MTDTLDPRSEKATLRMPQIKRFTMTSRPQKAPTGEGIFTTQRYSNTRNRSNTAITISITAHVGKTRAGWVSFFLFIRSLLFYGLRAAWGMPRGGRVRFAL